MELIRPERKTKELDVILLNTRGKAWTGNGFSSSFRKATAHCGSPVLGRTSSSRMGIAKTRGLQQRAKAEVGLYHSELRTSGASG
jgi:hypothetical protein